MGCAYEKVGRFSGRHCCIHPDVRSVACLGEDCPMGYGGRVVECTDGPGVVVDDGRRIRRVSPGAAASELLDFFDNALFQSL